MGATLAAQSGGTTKEIMARLGHSPSKAALIYQHGVQERNKVIVEALDQIARTASDRSSARDGPLNAPPESTCRSGGLLA